MEELRCKGTPAQVMRRVLVALAEDPGLLWITDAGGESWPDERWNNLDFWGRLKPDIPDGTGIFRVMVLRGTWPPIGFITAERLPDYVLVTAHYRGERASRNADTGRMQREIIEDFAAMAPVWQRVKAELQRVGLVAPTAPTEPERTADAPKIGAPRLADLPDDDPRAIVMQNQVREYLRYMLRERDPKTQTAAADLVGKSRGALQRYRERWPAIEAEVKADMAAQRAQKVRKV